MSKKFLFTILMMCVCTLGVQAQSAFTVAQDGSGDYSTIQAAIDAAADGVRTRIYIKNGTYAEHVSLGSADAASKKLISLIGESEDGVIITSDVTMGTSGVTYDQSAAMLVYASDFYAENITFRNSSGNHGQALAIYVAGDRQTYYHCKFLGYQDTHRSKKTTRSYYKDCFVEGATDFIYAGGTAWFENCTLHCIGSGYITAPEDIIVWTADMTYRMRLYFGFIFNNCTVTRGENVSAGSVYLGRPWQDKMCGSAYINCNLGDAVNAAGWTAMGGNTGKNSMFAEYKSVDNTGALVDTTKRVSWSHQLAQSQVETYYTKEYVFNDVFLTRSGSSVKYYPDTLIAQEHAASTGITEITKSEIAEGDAHLYTIDGKRVAASSSLTPGVYIMHKRENGNLSVKKVLIK